MELKKEEAQQIYEHVPSRFKDKLEKEFGKETFRKITIEDLNTFDDLCKVKGTTESDFEAMLKTLPVSDQTKRFMRMELIAEVLNQNWIQDTLDKNQRKWAPIFAVSSSGLDFSYSDYYYDIAHASVGSCFCYVSEEVSNHAGTKFIKYWSEFIAGRNF
jgi:hypothetical protein